MRLIDADAYKEKHKKIIDCDICHPLYGDTLRELIDEAPTVNAMPVVNGKWLHDESGANYCSECMKYAYEDEEYHMIWHTQYCPHCGAKMNESGEQDATD